MKQTAILVLFASALTLAAAPVFVYETPTELQADGDFNGDSRRDAVIVDKATGNYRLGYQQANGTYLWVSPRASGIAGATGLGVGKLNALGYDSLVFTGPEANRVNVLDPSLVDTPGIPVSIFPPVVGPHQVVALNIGGTGNTAHDDLYVASRYNGSVPYRETLLRNTTSTNRPVLADGTVLNRRERANAILIHTNRNACLAVFERGAGPTYDYLTVSDAATGVLTPLTALAAGTNPRPSEYLSGQFISNNPFTQILLYAPTGWYLFEYQFMETPLGDIALQYTNTFTFTNYLDRIYTLPGASGTRLLVFYTNGVSGAVYTFDGVNLLQAIQQFNAPDGEHFTGAGVGGGYDFTAYSAPLGQNTSSRFSQWKWTGSQYTNSATGDLPLLSRYSASGNVLQFRHEPFVTNQPVLLRLNNAGDWSSRPAFTGSPYNLAVRTEKFLSATQGLGNPVNMPLGLAHPLASFGLANQYSNMISLFSFTPPMGDKVSDVSISPLPGTYPTAVQLRFAAANPTDTIFFRVGQGAWTTWNPALVVHVFTNAQVQYYGQPAGNAAKSTIQTAAYQFTVGAGGIDSDKDGVPDFVESARGLNPTSGPDGDGDGYSDLEELIRNRNPLDGTSVPTNWLHLNDRSAFDFTVRPLPWDGFSNRTTLSATGTAIRVYDFKGSLLGMDVTTNRPLPFARLTNITVIAEDRLQAYATDLHYNILTTNADQAVGREMIGLLAVPPLQLPQVNYQYGGSNMFTEATQWVLTASNTYRVLSRAVVTNTLTIQDTLQSLLVELKIAQLLGARGSNWWTNMTLYPFRVSDLGRTNPAQADLLALEQEIPTKPAFKLQTIYKAISNQVENSGAANISALRTVVQDIYRISSVLNNTNPAVFRSPVDAVRHFLWRGTLESNYLHWATSSVLFAQAIAGRDAILSSVAPRPTTNVMLTVRDDTAGGCRVLDRQGGGGVLALLNSSGLPFSFPENFHLLPGSKVQIYGFTDVTNAACGYPAIEVSSALLASVPVSTDADEDGNLLVDTWEKKFFGALGKADPPADDDHDGYSNLQEMLEGSDPRDVFGRPGVTAAAFNPPLLDFTMSGGQIDLIFQWPAAYVEKFNFRVRHVTDLGAGFTDLPAFGPVAAGAGYFKMTFNAPVATQHFYYLTISLR